MSKRYSQKQAAARVVREQLARERRRRVQLWTSLGVVMALVVAGAAGWLIYSSQRGDSYTAPSHTYKDDVGFVVGDGPKLVELYFDYQCPGCRAFETQSKDTLDEMVAAKKVKVVYYTVAILDRYSKNTYSTRAAATAACAADEGKIVDYTQALMANQPAENTAGPTDDQLIKTGKTVGLGNSFANCVKDRKYTNWTKRVTDNFEKRGLNSTPSVFVDGKKMDGLAALIAAVNGEAAK